MPTLSRWIPAFALGLSLCSPLAHANDPKDIIKTMAEMSALIVYACEGDAGVQRGKPVSSPQLLRIISCVKQNMAKLLGDKP